MKYRTLGKTGIKISEVGYGAWGIGGALWQGSEDSQSLKALHKAVDSGLNFIDTALAYGEGHSEQLVGRLLKGRKEQLYVATKIPPKNRQWPAKTGSKLKDVFPADYIVKCTEQSLRNLNVDAIDVQQFHVWLDDWAEDAEWFDAISRLKDEGKIKFFGVSINDHQPENALKLAATGKADTFQVIYNIFEQNPENKLFPVCQQHNIGIIVRVPFDEGALTGAITPDSVFPPDDFRNRYFRDDRKQQVFERITKLKQLLGKEAETLAELALRFCLHHPAVSTVIPGMRSELNVEANCSVSDGRTLSQELIAKLRAHRWERNFYQ
ncbi:MAG: aldo/keto reductase [Ignavibacteriales bacterium]|nr:aldo/keto reductase [Ignavibacteriales bacterium]